jgi:hypothetical protein
MGKRITYLSVLALVLAAICIGFGSSSPQPAHGLTLAQGNVDGRDFLIWQRNLGIVPGQMVRITGASEGGGRRTLTFQCMVFDQNGALVFQTATRQVPLRGFLREDITFGDLGLVAGDPLTERKQVMMEVRVQLPRGAKSADFIGSLELVDPDGKTTAGPTLLTQVALNGNSP